MAKSKQSIERTQEIVNRLETLAKEHDIAPTALALSLGLAKSSFSDWRKKASPSLDALLKFSNYFHVSLDYLVTGSDSAYSPIQRPQASESSSLAPETKALVSKYESLPSELRGRADAYMDVLSEMASEQDRGKSAG